MAANMEQYQKELTATEEAAYLRHLEELNSFADSTRTDAQIEREEAAEREWLDEMYCRDEEAKMWKLTLQRISEGRANKNDIWDVLQKILPAAHAALSNSNNLVSLKDKQISNTFAEVAMAQRKALFEILKKIDG